MTNAISIYNQHDFEVQFEAVLHDRHIDNPHPFYPANEDLMTEKVQAFEHGLNSLQKQALHPVENKLNQVLPEKNIPQTRDQICGRTFVDGTEQDKIKAFTPINVGNRLRVMSEWDKTPVHTGQTLIKINPGASFSVERQAATFLCLEVMLELVGGGKRVLDLGAGSGATAIAAVKLGAGSVDALEMDQDLFKCAGFNVRRNDCGGKVHLFNGGHEDIPHNDYQVVHTHIGIHDLMGCFDSITKTMTKMKYFILSGIHQEQKSKLNSFLVERELFPSIVMQKNEWCTYLLRIKRGW